VGRAYRSLKLGGSYDQLNLCALASFEVPCWWLQQIVDAYARPDVPPDWSFARHLGGDVDHSNLVSLSLRSWATRNAEDEADIGAAQNRNLAPAAPGAGAGGGAGDGGGRGRGKADAAEGLPDEADTGGAGGSAVRGRGRGGRARQLAAAAPLPI